MKSCAGYFNYLLNFLFSRFNGILIAFLKRDRRDEDLSTLSMIVVALLFVVNLGLLSWAVTDLMQREKVKYLPKFGWIIIIALLPYGSVIYLFAGRG